MASQLNPVIAAFLQAQELGQRDAQNIIHQKQFQDRLAFEREAKQAEQELQQAKFKQSIEEAKAKNIIDQQKVENDRLARRAGAFRYVSDSVKAGTYDPTIWNAVGPSLFGLAPEEATQIAEQANSLAEIEKVKTDAKKEQTQNYFTSRTQSNLDTARGLIPTQKELLTFKSDLAQKEYQAKADADYKKAVDVAKIRAQSVIDGINKRAAVGGAKGEKKLTDSTKQKFVDLEVAENLYKEIGQFLEDPKKKQYFAGPVGAKLRGFKKSLQGLDATEAEVEAGLGRAVAVIGHPLFGAALTPNEKQVLLSFVPGETGDITPEAAKAKVDSGIKYIQSLRKAMLNAHGLSENTPSSPGNSSPNIDAIKARFGLK